MKVSLSELKEETDRLGEELKAAKQRIRELEAEVESLEEHAEPSLQDGDRTRVFTADELLRFPFGGASERLFFYYDVDEGFSIRSEDSSASLPLERGR